MFEILKEDVNQKTNLLGEATEPDLKTVDIAVDDSDSCNPYIDANDTEGTPFHGIGGMSDPEGDDLDELDDIDGDGEDDDDEEILDLLGEEEDALVAVLEGAALEGAALEGLPEDEEDEEEYDDIDLDENDDVEIEDYE